MAHEVTSPSYRRAYLLEEKLRQRPFYFRAKRLFDLFAATILLVLLSPLMLMVAVLIVLDSPGPAIFRQQRVGLKRRVEGGQTRWEIGTFEFLKFRTMKRDADPQLHRAYIEAFIQNDEEAMAAVQGTQTEVRKIVNDTRVTRLGKFLRKSSLDELPQLWCVVRGDMSLVGPRPAIPYEVAMYKPWHHQRLEALPGVTGPWQVSARSSVDFDDMVSMDIEYVENQSFWLDIKILLLTPLAVIRSKGAV